MIYQNFLGQRPKSDIIFYQAFQKLGLRSKRFAVVKALLACTLLAVGILNIIQNTASSDLIQTIIGCCLISVFGFAVNFYKGSYVYSKPIVLLALAEAKGHAVLDEVTTNFNRMEDCVSQRVFIANTGLNEMELDQPTKRTYLNASIRAIELETPVIFKGMAQLQRLHSILSITSLIYSIIVLCDPNITLLSKVTLATYVTIIGLSEILFILVLIVVCLVPLICVIVIFYYCCCRVTKGTHINVPVKNATMQDIMNVDGNCSICYQDIAQNQPIYQLGCSVKHVFHKRCLQNWTRIKQNCPICRVEIPMADGPPLPQQE